MERAVAIVHCPLSIVNFQLLLLFAVAPHRPGIEQDAESQ